MKLRILFVLFCILCTLTIGAIAGAAPLDSERHGFDQRHEQDSPVLADDDAPVPYPAIEEMSHSLSVVTANSITDPAGDLYKMNWFKPHPKTRDLSVGGKNASVTLLEQAIDAPSRIDWFGATYRNSNNNGYDWVPNTGLGVWSGGTSSLTDPIDGSLKDWQDLRGATVKSSSRDSYMDFKWTLRGNIPGGQPDLYFSTKVNNDWWVIVFPSLGKWEWQLTAINQEDWFHPSDHYDIRSASVVQSGSDVNLEMTVNDDIPRYGSGVWYSWKFDADNNKSTGQQPDGDDVNVVVRYEGGITGNNGYRGMIRRFDGSGYVDVKEIPFTRSRNTMSTSVTVEELGLGSTYRWRANVFIITFPGCGQSPGICDLFTIADVAPNSGWVEGPACYKLSTATDPSNGGSISVNPERTCYDGGTKVTLTADPAAGYMFENWSGAVTGSKNPVQITMNGDRSVIAHFGKGGADIEVIKIASFSDENSESLLHAEEMTVYVELYNKGDIAVHGEVCLYLNDRIIEDGCAKYPTKKSETDLVPEGFDHVAIPWSLDGYGDNRIVNSTLEVRATVEDHTDIDELNNSYIDSITSYWADYAAGTDGYQFPNDTEYTEAMWKAGLTELLEIRPSGIEKLAQVWNVFWDKAFGADGLCFGMSTTSIFYQQNAVPIPDGRRSTYALTREEALPNVRMYHRNQLLFWRADALAIGNPPPLDVEFREAEAVLKQGKPAEIRLDSDDRDVAHSVVAYKSIVLSTQGKRILFVYDPNKPFKGPPRGNISPKIEIDQRGQGIEDEYSDYDYFTSHNLDPKLIGDDSALAKALEIARAVLVRDGVMTVFVGSPVDPLIIDAQGRRTGVVNDVDVNEIPGARMEHFGDKVTFSLPDSDEYSFQAAGLSNVASGDTMTFAYQRPIAKDSILEISFSDVPIESSKRYTSDFAKSAGSVPPLKMPDGSSRQPDDVETVEVDPLPIRASHFFFPITLGKFSAPVSFSAPTGTQPNGLAWDGQNLWMSSYMKEPGIYKLNPKTGSVLLKCTPAVAKFRGYGGLTFDGTYLWQADSYGSGIYKLNPDNCSIISIIPAPNDDADDLAWDGKFLWTSGSPAQKLYKLNPANGSIVATFNYPEEMKNAQNVGMTFDGNFLWLAASNKMFKLNPSNGQLLATKQLSFSRPESLAWDGKYIWTASFDDGRIYRVDPDLFMD